MKIKCYVEENYDSNCYSILNDQQAIIIDPAVDRLKLQLDKTTKIVAVILTHAHFDHFIALESYLDEDIPIYLHPYAVNKLANPLKNFSCFCTPKVAIKVPERFVRLTADKQELSLANLHLKIMHTSGHSNCSQCIIIDDVIFTGDTLFKDSVGRTDLPTGDSKSLRQSLTRLYDLCCNYTIYPGHGEATTLEAEKMTNLYLKGEQDV